MSQYYETVDEDGVVSKPRKLKRPHPRVRKSFRGEVSLAKQEFRDECDINNVMRKYEKTGLLDHVNKFQGQYGDFSEVVDYQSALNAVMSADAAFLTLPAGVRARFENDPAGFLEFVENGTEDELREAGLLPRQPPVAVEAPGEPPEEVEAVDEG